MITLDVVSTLVRRLNTQAALPEPAVDHAERGFPVPAGPLTDVRNGLTMRLAPALSHEEIYDSEPTTWGVGGYVPPCPASLRAEVRELPPVPELPPLPAIVLRHPPRPFRLFEEAS